MMAAQETSGMSTNGMAYEDLLAEVVRLQSEGRLPTTVSREQMIDWAYGTTKIENEDVTVEIATKAVDDLLASQQTPPGKV